MGYCISGRGTFQCFSGLNSGYVVTLSENMSNGTGKWLSSTGKGVSEIGALCVQLGELANSGSFIERHALFPLKDKTSFDFYKKQTAAFWTVEELDFSGDVDHYTALSPEIRDFLDSILAFFTVVDGLVIEGIFMPLYMEAKSMEERMNYQSQLMIETVHAEAYNKMLNALIPANRRKEVIGRVESMKSIKTKDEWIESYTESNLSKSHILLAFSCAEGIFLMSPIGMIYYFRKGGKFPGMTFTNEQISKDECLHNDYGEVKYVEEGRISDKEAHTIVQEAVELECITIDEFLPKAKEGLNPEDLKTFVKHLGNRKLTRCGHPTLWDVNVSSLPTWLKDVSMVQKTNFHELNVGNYAKHSKEEGKGVSGAIATFATLDF